MTDSARIHRHRRVIVAVVVVSFTLGACGGSTATPTPAAPATPATNATFCDALTKVATDISSPGKGVSQSVINADTKKLGVIANQLGSHWAVEFHNYETASGDAFVRSFDSMSAECH